MFWRGKGVGEFERGRVGFLGGDRGRSGGFFVRNRGAGGNFFGRGQGWDFWVGRNMVRDLC